MAIVEQLADRQLDAYNRQNLEEFLEVYSEDVEIRSFPSQELLYAGKVEMRKVYKRLFDSNPRQKAVLLSRMIKGSICIDHEKVKGRASGEETEAVAMYEAEAGRIKRVWFVI
ncbi:nuclear transport factor 2 family protein [Bacillus infantis]|uniref:nuclear transport factor 2 family protein n=1 Tax=Bacillus infantis TaxID=324767 RepID=UPI003CF4B6D1